jgi:hypothetical protein
MHDPDRKYSPMAFRRPFGAFKAAVLAVLRLDKKGPSEV